MLFVKNALIATTCCLAMSAQALSLPSSIDGKTLAIEGQPLPDKCLTTNNTDTNVELVARTPIKACAYISATAACFAISKDLYHFAKTLGGGIKALSDQHNCAHSTGTIDNIRYDYYASGRNCDTTAQINTIAGAIYKYIDKIEHGNICGTQCVRLDHGGTWKGWLRMGHASSYNDKAYCGPGLNFDSCISGGNNDI
ncbi:hypothetical protein BDV25DRAFT_134998 [Aspergillus avenaceus]|uniref:Secreted protein CSS2 C-terminal domain-containing protein n=1 Tax=Aspergillus avenaceus TaxID=36643 RepID=A0A5N6UAM8_ASPAV|nr:hypothetical protein BDV25DRAFT_134998 [Aspergillus avenaceus]